VFEKVREKLVKMEVSFSKEEILKENNIRTENSRLDSILFFSFYFFLILNKGLGL